VSLLLIGIRCNLGQVVVSLVLFVQKCQLQARSFHVNSRHLINKMTSRRTAITTLKKMDCVLQIPGCGGGDLCKHSRDKGLNQKSTLGIHCVRLSPWIGDILSQVLDFKSVLRVRSLDVLSQFALDWYDKVGLFNVVCREELGSVS